MIFCVCILFVIIGIIVIYHCKHRYWVYGTLGSGKLFWQRLFCRHSWEFLDGYGMRQKCRKCGRFKSWR